MAYIPILVISTSISVGYPPADVATQNSPFRWMIFPAINLHLSTDFPEIAVFDDPREYKYSMNIPEDIPLNPNAIPTKSHSITIKSH